MSENGSCENGAETGIDIANDLRKLYAKTYWSEDSLTADGEIPKVKAISTAELADRIEAAARRAEDSIGKLKEALVVAKGAVDDMYKYLICDVNEPHFKEVWRMVNAKVDFALENSEKETMRQEKESS